MSLVNLTLLSGATCSATGGTIQTFAPDSQSVAGGIHLIDINATNFITMANITAKVKQPSILSDGSYSKDKKTAMLVRPFVDSKGKTQFCLVEIRREVHPEYPAADAVKLLSDGAQLCFRADMAAFWANGSLQ